MKAIKVITILLCLVFASSCEMLENDVMFCQNNTEIAKSIGLPSPNFEISYHNNTIKKVKVVTSGDYSNLGEKEFKDFVDYMERMSDIEDETKGISSDITVDDKLVTKTVQINIDTYDVEADVLRVIPLTIEKKDFKDINALRSFLDKNKFDCDKTNEKQ